MAADQQVVVIALRADQERAVDALRLSETYTAPQSYRLDGDELVFERSLGRPRNSVVLPRGWYLTALSIPAVVRQTPDGLTRIDFVNGRPDSVDVLIKGKRLADNRMRCVWQGNVRWSPVFRAFVFGVAASLTAAPIRLARHPDYHGGKIAFSYLGDIWIANEDGANVACG